MKPITRHSEYLDTLLLYHEEEIMGEAYFNGLAAHYTQPHERSKLALLADVERYAAEAVRPLLLKYKLVPRKDAVLTQIGESWIENHRMFDWRAFVTDMAERYPLYLVQFDALHKSAPAEDQPAIQVMTNHEIAAIEFAKMEIANNADSLEPIHKYLKTGLADGSEHQA